MLRAKKFLSSCIFHLCKFRVLYINFFWTCIYFHSLIIASWGHRNIGLIHKVLHFYECETDLVTVLTAIHIFFSEQPLYGNYSTLNSHTNTVISHAVTYSSRWPVGKSWLTTSFPLIRKTGQWIYQQSGPDLSNRTKPNKKPIEPNRTPIVRLGWAIEQNRTPILLWVRFSNQSNQYNRTKSN